MAAVKIQYGLLWYDADKKRPAREKIDEAAERYVEKFGARPDTCYVHLESPAEHPQLRVVRSPLVLPNHFLIGVETGKPPGSNQSPAATRAAVNEQQRRHKAAPLGLPDEPRGR